VVDVDSWVVRLWFDLVSKNMAAPDRTRSARHLIDVRPSGMARDLPTSYARKAFEDNFAEYLRRIRRMANPDRFTLYSVSEAIAERFGSLVFRMDENLVFDPEPHLRPTLAIPTEDVPSFRPLATAMLDEYRKLNWMVSSASALSEFSVLSGNTSITDAHGGTNYFDLAGWLSLSSGQLNPNRQNLVGASYIRRNVEFLTNLIDNLPKPTHSIEASNEYEITWYRPGGSGWGCSPELQEALLSIKLAMRRNFGKIPIRTKLICPSISRRADYPDRFKNLFDEGHIAPPGLLSPAVEVVYIPRIGTVMLVTVALSDGVQIPVGFASVAAEPLARVARKLARVDVHLDELWRSGKREEEGESLAMEPDIEDPGDA
jgi:hypothetical protein